MYDEERDELNAQFHHTGDYRRTNPDLAVGSTAQLPDSAPTRALYDPLTVRKLYMDRANLLAALEELIAEDDDLDKHQKCESDCPHQIARTAIAKARGNA